MGEAFLGVAKSAKGFRWVPRLDDHRLATTIAQRHDLPEIIARVLAARNVQSDNVEAFLNPTLRGLMPAPTALRDLEKGAARLAAAIKAREKIGIISDYDVDGVSSAALLLKYLEAAGTTAQIHIPDRMTEGYGPSILAVDKLKAGGATLLLTLDCGVLSHDPLAHAAEQGLEAIIVDHHQTEEDLPQAVAVINPNRQDDTSGLGALCAAGVVFLLLAATNKHLRQSGYFSPDNPEPNLLQWLELVALATVCDVVPLVGLNRAYVTQGLKVMARRENHGLAALADVAGLKRRPDPYALGFMLGPRLNAAGRIGHAQEALDLLMAGNRSDGHNLAQALDAMNRKRQAMELRIVEDAYAQADASLGRMGNASVIIATGETWHPGVAGLVAARLKEKFHLPSFALASNVKTGMATGSGRSVTGVDLGSAVRAAHTTGLIEKGGGHAMAAGLTVKIEQLSALRHFMDETLRAQVAATQNRDLLIDGALSAGAITADLVELLDQAGPYGQGNPPPVFALPAHRIQFAQPVGADHIRCTIAGSDGTKLKAIAFRAMGTDVGELLLSERQQPLHIAGRIAIDEWNGKRQASLQIEDVSTGVATP
jgi:single-stranded-DNA-specific exonuclease